MGSDCLVKETLTTAAAGPRAKIATAIADDETAAGLAR
jgi:hypothetical protein